MVTENEIAKSNVDPETGIHHGVISQRSILEEAFDEFSFDYGKPHCPKCGGEVSPVNMGQFDFFCLKCSCGIRGEDVYPDQPVGFLYDQDGYFLVNSPGNNILVLRSNFYTYAQFGTLDLLDAGNLDSPMEGGVKTYALGHDWFKSGIAPYPLYRVEETRDLLSPTQITQNWQAGWKMNFLDMNEFPLAPGKSIDVKVWEDYNAMDHLAMRVGYSFIEPFNDEWVDEDGLRVGMQNWSLHSGWIAALGDSYHVVEDMVTLLNRKVQRVRARGVGFLVGFCHTGQFCVGYTIYVKGEKYEWN